MIALCSVGILTGGLFAVNAQEKEEEKIPIKKVMETAHKSGLWKKVVAKTATEEEEAELLKLYKALSANTPPKGDKESWKTKTDALVKAAQAAVDDKDDAGQLLTKAANCAACHKVHKGD